MAHRGAVCATAKENKMIDIPWSVGPHLMEGFEGTSPGDAGVEVLRHKAEAGEIGGVILFGYNIEGPDQLQTLTRYIASWDVPEPNRPLLVSVDQEGGRVERLSGPKGFAGWPSAAEVGRSTTAQAERSVAGLPQELAAYGVNLNFAPVVDVSSGPRSLMGGRGRSFGEDPEVVASLAAQSIAAHRQHGVLAAVKHFPGLGACSGDTHEDLIDGTHSWQRRELIPYQWLLAHCGIDAVMSTHMVHTGLAPSGLPLTFSRAIMHDLLREELGFDGVLFTDDLGMGSIVRHYDIESVIAQTMHSSHDVLVFGQNAAASDPVRAPAHVPIPRLFARATSAIQHALAHGQLTRFELEQSDQRLLHMKQGLRAAAVGRPPT